MNDIDSRNKSERNLTTAHRAVFWSHRVSIPTLDFPFPLPAESWLGLVVQVFLQVPNICQPEFLFIQFHSAPARLLSKQTNSLFMFSVLVCTFPLSYITTLAESRAGRALGGPAVCAGGWTLLVGIIPPWVSTSSSWVSSRWDPGDGKVGAGWQGVIQAAGMKKQRRTTAPEVGAPWALTWKMERKILQDFKV